MVRRRARCPGVRALAILLVASTAIAGDEESAREAIAHAKTPPEHAVALYRLGLIQEAEGDRAGAAVSYFESLQLQADPIVRARLARIDRELADSFDPFAPEKLLGPFASLDDFGCQTGHTPETVIELAPGKLRAPYRGAVAFTIACAGAALFAGVQLDDGWYVTQLAGSSGDDAERCGSEPTARAIALVRGRLRFDYVVETSCSARHADSSWGTTETDRVVIGIGPSRVPAATAPITSARRDWQQTSTEEAPGAKRGPTTVFPIAWHTDGSFTIARPRHGVIDPNLVGRHAPRFP